MNVNVRRDSVSRTNQNQNEAKHRNLLFDEKSCLELRGSQHFQVGEIVLPFSLIWQYGERLLIFLVNIPVGTVSVLIRR